MSSVNTERMKSLSCRHNTTLRLCYYFRKKSETTITVQKSAKQKTNTRTLEYIHTYSLSLSFLESNYFSLAFCYVCYPVNNVHSRPEYNHQNWWWPVDCFISIHPVPTGLTHLIWGISWIWIDKTMKGSTMNYKTIKTIWFCTREGGWKEGRKGVCKIPLKAIYYCSLWQSILSSPVAWIF